MKKTEVATLHELKQVIEKRVAELSDDKCIDDRDRRNRIKELKIILSHI